jgi:CheY-like chemotaxis protein
MRVLVFETEQQFAVELRSELLRLGCEVQVFKEGATGLMAAAAVRPDLVLLSVDLPRMNGFSVCNKLKKDPSLRGVPIVLMSSEVGPDAFDYHAKLPTRADDYVRKPIGAAELVERVRKLGVAIGGAAAPGHLTQDSVDIIVDDNDFEAIDEAINATIDQSQSAPAPLSGGPAGQAPPLGGVAGARPGQHLFDSQGDVLTLDDIDPSFRDAIVQERGEGPLVLERGDAPGQIQLAPQRAASHEQPYYAQGEYGGEEGGYAAPAQPEGYSGPPYAAQGYPEGAYAEQGYAPADGYGQAAYGQYGTEVQSLADYASAQSYDPSYPQAQGYGGAAYPPPAAPPAAAPPAAYGIDDYDDERTAVGQHSIAERVAAELAARRERAPQPVVWEPPADGDGGVGELDKALAQAQQAERAAAEAGEKLAEIEAERDALREELAVQRAQVEELQTRLDALQARIGEEAARAEGHEGLEAELQEQRARVEQLLAEKALSEKRAADFKAGAKKIADQLDQRSRALRDVVQRHETELGEAREAHEAALRQQEERHRAEIAELERLHQAAVDRALEAGRGDLDRERTELAMELRQAEAARGEALRRVAEGDAALAELRSLVAQREADLGGALEEALAAAAQHEVRTRELEGEVRQLREVLADHEQRLEELARDHASELESSRVAEARVQAELGRVQEQREAEARAHAARVAGLEAERDAARASVEQLGAAVAQRDEALGLAHERERRVCDELEEAGRRVEQLERLEEQAATLLAQRDELRVERDALRAARDGARAERDGLAAELETSRRAEERARAELAQEHDKHARMRARWREEHQALLRAREAMTAAMTQLPADTMPEDE